jgi:hypothetical protein
MLPATTLRLFGATQTVHLGGDYASRLILNLYDGELRTSPAPEAGGTG